MQKVLIIDDDVALVHLVGRFLNENGYKIKAIHQGAHALAVVQMFKPDLILLDLMLPDVDGLTVCKYIRSDFTGKILMMTALGDDIDQVTGLELGADDYLPKPIKPRILLARIRAQLRTYHKDISQPQYHLMKIDARTREVKVGPHLVDCTTSEFDLLEILASHKGEVVSRDFLHKEIFRIDYDGIDRTIDLRISRIRKKLAHVAPGIAFIKTVRNTGYLFCDY
ncbi:response regulator transcription factor [Pseudoalteromonas xiamenensis]|uniref:response regulator transcription factor n=1 Tax=Pseudoalteromonas xiamenensis TaxID=882626 RepID=UPI0035EF8193